jgi:ATP-dependent helicase HrpB
LLVPLHGGLDAEAQDLAVRASTTRRIILATNIAETTLTVPGVTCVIDTGLQKVARYDPERAIDSLDTERIASDSADQRAGRAGRTEAGYVLRLWDARDRLRPAREPEISRVDLAGPALDILAWGGDPLTFEWFESPRAESLEAALDLLQRLGAIDRERRLTALGAQLRRLPLHPRLGRILIDANGAPEAARACALLSERHAVPARTGATSCDLLAAVDREQALPAHVLRSAREIRESARRTLPSIADRIDESGFRRAVLAGYPDRVARRRAPNGDRLVLTSGSGAHLARESGVVNAEFLVAVDVTAGIAGPAGEALVRLATGIERDWLSPTSIATEHELDPVSGTVRAARVERYDQLILRKIACAPDPLVSASLLADAYVRRGPTDADRQMIQRLKFAGVSIPFESLVGAASLTARRLDDLDPGAHVPAQIQRALARDAPLTFAAPHGRVIRLEYRDDGVFAAAKLQDLFGLSETPRLGPDCVPVTFELLAPNGRPVQVTKDLKSFWAVGYAEIRRELRGRYPKHAWPEEPH